MGSSRETISLTLFEIQFKYTQHRRGNISLFGGRESYETLHIPIQTLRMRNYASSKELTVRHPHCLLEQRHAQKCQNSHGTKIYGKDDTFLSLFLAV